MDTKNVQTSFPDDPHLMDPSHATIARSTVPLHCVLKETTFDALRCIVVYRVWGVSVSILDHGLGKLRFFVMVKTIALGNWPDCLTSLFQKW